MPENKRMPTFVYIDQAADYFDCNIGIILKGVVRMLMRNAKPRPIECAKDRGFLNYKSRNQTGGPPLAYFDSV